MNTNTLKKMDSFMDQQIDVLKQMLELADAYEARKLPGDLDVTELQQLKDYTADMMLACTTAQKLTKLLLPVLEKEDKEKAAKAKAKVKAEVEKAKNQDQEKTEAASDDDNMDFLD